MPDHRALHHYAGLNCVWDEWAEHFDVELVSSDGVLAIGDSALARLRVLNQVGGVEAHEIDAVAVTLLSAVARTS